MPDSRDALRYRPWWFPEVALAWLGLTIAYAALTWTARTCDVLVVTAITTALTALLFVTAALTALMLIWDAEDPWDDFRDMNRLALLSLVLLLGTLGVGCLTGYVLG